MKVLVLHNDYLLQGGEYFSVREEVQGLRDVGLDVRFVERSNEDEMANGALARVLQILGTRDSYELVASTLEHFDPDVVHAQNLFPLFGAGAIKALGERRVPWVRTLRNYRRRCLSANLQRNDNICMDCISSARGWSGVQHACYRGSRIASAAALGYAINEHRASEFYPPHTTIVLSERMRQLLPSEARHSRLVVKPNPVAQIALPVETRRFDVVFVGRLTPDKRAEVAVSVAAAMPQLQVAIVGDGPAAAQVLMDARELPNLTWLGEVNSESARAIMANALLTIVPSAWEEPFGRVAAESLSVGTPSLVSNRGGLADIVSAVSPTLVVNSDDDAAWIGAVETLRNLPASQYDKLRLKCLEHWQDNFSPEVLTSRLIAIYQQAISAPRNSA